MHGIWKEWHCRLVGKDLGRGERMTSCDLERDAWDEGMDAIGG
jgi:hypothetical protein